MAALPSSIEEVIALAVTAIVSFIIGLFKKKPKFGGNPD